MSINSILNTGTRGMAVSTAQTQTASTNISNAATVGYTRRTLVAYPDNVLSRGESPTRVMEPFIQKRVLTAQSTASEAASYRSAVDVLDQLTSEDDGNIGPELDNFQTAINQLNAAPDDVARRQQLITQADSLSKAFNNAHDTLQQARIDGNTRVLDSVRQVNQRLHEISKLSGQISTSEVGGQEASGLRDQRDLLISQVAERIPVTVQDQGNGQVTLTLNGQHSLVAMDGKVTELSASVSDTTGEIRISRISAGATVDITASVTSGSVGAQLKTFSGPLAQAKQKLDQLAYDVSNAYNAVHTAGVGLDGVGGRNLFQVPTGVANAARSMAVSADVLGNPRNIAAATEPGLPSDNRNALALARVGQDKTLADGQSINDAMESIVSFAGTTVQSAITNQTFTNGAFEQIQALRDNVSGVSTDEEMVEMMKFQRAYQASLRVIQTADEMYGDLLALR